MPPSDFTDKTQYEVEVSPKNTTTWALKTGGISYGDLDLNSAGVDLAVVDTTSVYIGLPDAAYSDLQAQFAKDLPDFNCYSGPNCFTSVATCDQYSSKMSDFKVSLGDYLFTLPPLAYTYSGDGDSEPKCSILLSHSGEKVVIGLAFLFNFNSIFDQSQGTVSFSQNTSYA